jgi:hypothetical protein
VEDGQAIRTRLLTNSLGSAYTGGAYAATTNAYGGQEMPDIVGNLRVDQAWGSAQISGVLHQLRVNQALSIGPPFSVGGTPASDQYGWAVLGGIEIKTPSIAPGDSIMLQGVYSKGAVEYTGISASPLGIAQGIGYKNVAGVGPSTDIWDSSLGCIGSPTTQCLSTAWSWNLMFRHFWQPNLRSAFWVGENRYEIANNIAPTAPSMTIWQAGGNIIWSPAPTLDLSLDVLWTRLETDANVLCGAQNGVTCGVAADNWSIWTRWRRNF